MVQCAVKNCGNYPRKTKGQVKYFLFPKNKDLFDKWVRACGITSKERIAQVRKYGSICSNHFVDDDYTLKDILLNTPVPKRKLKANALPTINTHTSVQSSKRATRYQTRERKRIVDQLLTNSNHINKVDDIEHNTNSLGTFNSETSDEEITEYIEEDTESVPSSKNFSYDILNEEIIDEAKYVQDLRISPCYELLNEETIDEEKYVQDLRISPAYELLNENTVEETYELNENDVVTTNSIKKDAATQTMTDLNSALELRVLELQKENLRLKKELNEKSKCACKSLGKFFTDGQLKKLFKMGKRVT